MKKEDLEALQKIKDLLKEATDLFNEVEARNGSGGQHPDPDKP